MSLQLLHACQCSLVVRSRRQVLWTWLCCAADKPIEFVLVDGGLIQSKSVAIQIGDETHAPMSTLVFQNITIQQSHRYTCNAFHPGKSASIF